jgi:hypothetical protein
LPLRRVLVIEETEKLIVVDRLGVDDVSSDLLVALLIIWDTFLRFFILQLAASILKDLPGG